jgi:hypothetical protein
VDVSWLLLFCDPGWPGFVAAGALGLGSAPRNDGRENKFILLFIISENGLTLYLSLFTHF